MDTKQEMIKQRDVVDKVLDFMKDEGILSHLRHKRLSNDVRHWYLTKCGALEEYRKRKYELKSAFLEIDKK